MSFFQVRPSKSLQNIKYRLYSLSLMTNAYLVIKDKTLSVRRAAQQYNVPETTLRQRVLGRVDVDRTASGRFPIHSQEEESQLVEHLKAMARVGYGYTRQEVVDMASEFVVALNKRDGRSSIQLKMVP